MDVGFARGLAIRGGGVEASYLDNPRVLFAPAGGGATYPGGRKYPIQNTVARICGLRGWRRIPSERDACRFRNRQAGRSPETVETVESAELFLVASMHNRGSE